MLYPKETNIQRFSACKRYVWRSDGKRYDAFHTPYTVKRSADVITRNDLSVKGTAGGISLHTETIRISHDYAGMLKDKLELYVNGYNCRLYIQNGADYHR